MINVHWLNPNIWESPGCRNFRGILIDGITYWYASYHKPFPEFSTAPHIPFWNSYLPKTSRTSSLSWFSLVWSLAASLFPVDSSSYGIPQCFPKHGIYIHFRWHIYNNESCHKKISLSCPQAFVITKSYCFPFHSGFLFNQSRLRLRGFRRQQYLAKIQFDY